ncbi:MAG: hypothetical protein QNJ55_09725 [Xenococcus sp. MO_188.B8]|nr:hypothetical protein [Xenococcus sp. MO_188.B8]
MERSTSLDSIVNASIYLGSIIAIARLISFFTQKVIAMFEIPEKRSRYLKFYSDRYLHFVVHQKCDRNV